MKNKSVVHSSLLHLLLYSILLFTTPFIMLQNFLQEAIGMLSRFSFQAAGIEVPFVVIVAFLVLIIIIVTFRRHLNRFRFFSAIATVLMVLLAQRTTDYYFSHRFFDLQHNWHYIAYGIFSYFIYRFLKEKGTTTSRIILYTFIAALSISTFDETFQMFMSNRIFDICDIAKDGWGAVVGMTFIFFVIENGRILYSGWQFRQKRISKYLKYPLSLLFLEAVFTYFLLFYSSILSEVQYWWYVMLFTLFTFLFFIYIFHKSQSRIYRITFIILAALAILVQSFFCVKYRNDNIIYNKYGLTVYKGIPIPFFDVMFHPGGTFRFVDKKHSFNQRDQNFIFSHAPYILLVGSGAYGKGGKGFPEDKKVQFMFNPETSRGLQVIILRTPEACMEFNRLKREGKNVLFILHNTC